MRIFRSKERRTMTAADADEILVGVERGFRSTSHVLKTSGHANDDSTTGTDTGSVGF